MKMTPLPITLDITPVVYGRGVSRYTSNLARALAIRRDVDLTVFGSSWGLWSDLRLFHRSMSEPHQSSLWRVPSNIMRQSWKLTGQPKPVSANGVFHAWDWQVPHWPKQPVVVSIYDLAYKLFPQTAHPVVKKRYDQLLAQVEQSANIHVITTSHTSREDILRLTAIEPTRVHMVYPALPQEAKLVPTAEEKEQTLRKYHLRNPFLLFVGTTEPRKNLPMIIKAWEQLQDQFELVIVGAAGWEDYQVKPGMHVLGYVSSGELAALYRKAEALLYVSLYEGFGLPILEAYWHHCPVITANRSSMAEVAGTPAVLVNPDDPEDIAERVLSLEGRESRARQKREKDMDQVLQQYSWERAAEQTLAVYQQARKWQT